MQTDSLSVQSVRDARARSPRYGARHHAPIHPPRPPFDSLAIGLHWVTAFLVLTLLATAWLHALAEEQKSDLMPFLLQTHRSVGALVWTITAFRLTWRLTLARLLPFPAQMSRPHRAAVTGGEYALYALLLGQPVTGLLTTLFGGRPFALLVWQVPPLFPRNDILRVAFHFTHELGAWTLASLVAVHAAVALFHHFVLRDDVLACMTPGLAAPRRAQHRNSGNK